ncbi:response regulator transcription factor [Sapientia aquatica]|uniref:Response regulator transcription factor n=1 Tax=Sapientia aquatica TaxID=1549640 RepID=A0A4R5W7R1_9BURK|nr:response regulator [Sapientia aquatica]TDK68504.1 response regulator transcription factor [Sapientia aquatica]
MIEPTVFLIDDDGAVRDSLSLLIRSIGLRVQAFEDVQQFLNHYQPDVVCCLILDIRMPGVNGLSFQESLNEMGSTIPIIFITGHGDLAQCTRAFKAGAVDFLVKPIDEQALIDCVQKTIKLSEERYQARRYNEDVLLKIGRLTDREKLVLELIVDGLPNKTIADKLGVSVRTIESHRANAIEKLEVTSLADCVKLQLAYQEIQHQKN